jgi:hypothetical protein
LAQAGVSFAPKKTKEAMFKVIVSVGIYAAVIVLLLKSVIEFCDSSRNDIVTEP